LGFTLPYLASATSYGFACSGNWNEAATRGAIQWNINNTAAVADADLEANFVTPTAGAPTPADLYGNHLGSFSANTNSLHSFTTIRPTSIGQAPFWITGSI
jgi:hypothetical protein